METWMQRYPGCPVDWQLRPPEAGVEVMRVQLLAALDDCHGPECDRLRWRLHTAERPQELWLLRDQILQVLTDQHCLALARERVEALLPAFGAPWAAGMGDRA
jgi:hypothetical protein